MNAHRIASAGLLMTLFVAGCAREPASGHLTGKVTFAGQVLRSGALKVVDASGKETNTTIGTDGSYRLSNVAVGRARLAVFTNRRNPLREKQADEQVVDLPPRYGNPEHSGLEVDVRRGDQTFDVVMSP